MYVYLLLFTYFEASNLDCFFDVISSQKALLKKMLLIRSCCVLSCLWRCDADWFGRASWLDVQITIVFNMRLCLLLCITDVCCLELGSVSCRCMMLRVVFDFFVYSPYSHERDA